MTAAALTSPGSRSTVLIVEDEWLIRSGAAAAFEHDGWLVRAVGSGEEALSLLHQPTRIDLVFTDIQLAGSVDGWEVGRACAAGDVPVLYTSGKAQTRVEPDRFFAKPYDPALVAHTSRDLLRH